MTTLNKLYWLSKLAKYKEETRTKPVLTDLFFELTDSCNLACLHCGSNCLSTNKQFLDFCLIEKTLNEIAAVYNTSKIWINITGGEPLLHPDLMKTIELSRKLGFRCGMTSNGTLITADKAKQLADSGLETIAVSLDGLKETHEAFRGKKNCFDLALKGVENLRKYGIESQAISVIHKKNIHQLDEMFDFFLKNNFYSWRVINLEPIGRANDNNELLLNASEIKYLLDFIRKKHLDSKCKMEVTYGCSHFLPLKYEMSVRDFIFSCGAGTRVASVMVNGDIASCLDIERRPELIQGNVKTDNFVEIWEKKFENFRVDRTKNSKTCSECKYRKQCCGDSTHTWNFDSNEPNYCVMKMIQSNCQ